MMFDVAAAVSRLRAEYAGSREPVGAGEPTEAWEVLDRQIEPALAVGIRDEHEFKVLLAALGWPESSNRWGRVMGLEMQTEEQADE